MASSRFEDASILCALDNRARAWCALMTAMRASSVALRIRSASFREGEHGDDKDTAASSAKVRRNSEARAAAPANEATARGPVIASLPLSRCATIQEEAEARNVAAGGDEEPTDEGPPSTEVGNEGDETRQDHA